MPGRTPCWTPIEKRWQQYNEKKADLDPNELKNYPTVSYLPLLSQIPAKSDLHQLLQHFSTHSRLTVSTHHALAKDLSSSCDHGHISVLSCRLSHVGWTSARTITKVVGAVRQAKAETRVNSVKLEAVQSSKFLKARLSNDGRCNDCGEGEVKW